MQNGHWVPIHKAFVKHLPKNRAFTKLEAAFSMSVDYDMGKKNVTASGYAALWGWSRKKVSNFMKEIIVELEYPENVSKKQNQKAQIRVQIESRSGTDKEQIKFIDSKWKADEKNRSGTDKEQIRNRSGSTTINPKSLNLNPKPEEEEIIPPFSDEFEEWWNSYPKRKGRRIGKQKAASAFKKIAGKNLIDLKTATENYSKECNGLPKDPERFLRNDFWKDLLHEAETNEKPRSENYDADFASLL